MPCSVSFFLSYTCTCILLWRLDISFIPFIGLFFSLWASMGFFFRGVHHLWDFPSYGFLPFLMTKLLSYSSLLSNLLYFVLTNYWFNYKNDVSATEFSCHFKIWSINISYSRSLVFWLIWNDIGNKFLISDYFLFWKKGL